LNPYTADLTAGDFSFRYVVSAHAGAIPNDFVAPNAVSTDIMSDSGLWIRLNLKLQPESQHAFNSIKNPNKYWVYRDDDPDISGLQSMPYIESIAGTAMSAKLPTRMFRFQDSRLAHFELYMHVRGRRLRFESGDDGIARLTASGTDLDSTR